MCIRDSAWRVVADSYVTMTDGTGIVHQAPAFGEDDARVGRENDLPFLQLVDPRGCMAKELSLIHISRGSWRGWAAR